MEKYFLVLRNDKLRQYDRIALLIALLQVALFLILAIYAAQKYYRVMGFIGAGMVAAGLGLHYFLSRKLGGQGRNYLRITLWLATIGWIMNANWVAAIISFVLELLYTASRTRQTVGFYSDKIEITSFSRRAVQWDQLSNVVLRDGLLTLDFRNNKIIQREIEHEPGTLNERDFNEFCRIQLRDSGPR